MGEVVSNDMNIDGVFLKALSSYIRGRADEIAKRHIEEATKEINYAIRDEIAKTILNVSRHVSFERNGTDFVITIYDKTKEV